MSGTVLILGANGNIGRHASNAFTAAGWQVKAYDRSKNNMTEAARDVDVIVNGLNPPAYKNWATEIPYITQQVIAAARVSNATVIVPGNVYNFANIDGTFDENTPHNATTRKGRIRIAMEQAYAAASNDGVQTIVLRAGSFIDPDGSNDVMALIHMRDIKNRKLTQIGGADTRHAYCFLPDWGRAAVAIAEKRNSLDQFEDIPFPGHHFTINELKTRLEETTGQFFTINNFPWTIMKLASPFWGLAYELLEMRELWQTSHKLSGDKFARLLPSFSPTDLETVMQCSLPPHLLATTAINNATH